VDLADTYGLRRVFADAHPDLGAWVQAPRHVAAPAIAPARPAAEPQAARPPPATPYGMVLTPKEREVLELLARNLSNKEIGRALQVGETTVKWHVKNLFAKLDAGTRKQTILRLSVASLPVLFAHLWNPKRRCLWQLRKRPKRRQKRKRSKLMRGEVVVVD
jgi:LuxR family maltose regulon positive regulatory protein